MADSIFMAGRLVCNRAPGTCRVNASKICDGYYAGACFLLPPTSFSSLLSIMRARGFAIWLFLGIKHVVEALIGLAFRKYGLSGTVHSLSTTLNVSTINRSARTTLGKKLSTYDERVLGKRQIRWQWIVGATI